jgi:hypothetical protein
MQNNAVWLETKPNGVKVRVKFLPMNEAEANRIQRLLKNFRVVPVMATTEGPLSVDLFFTDEVAAPQPAVGKPIPAAPLTAAQKAALSKPDPTDKPA